MGSWKEYLGNQMDFFKLVEISTKHLELTTPATPEKLWTIGHYLDLNENKHLIDFGCGYGRTLAFWAKDFGISGVGVEIHSFLCKRAAERMETEQVSEKVEIVCTNSLDYKFKPQTFDVAICLGASFVWGGFRRAIQRMSDALKDEGKIVIGEPYFTKERVPQDLVKFEGDLHTEHQILEISREEKFNVEFVVRANRDDWDRFVSSNWYGLIRWIDENPTHPERHYVIDYLNRKQDTYFRYQKEYEGWAIYILKQFKQ